MALLFFDLSLLPSSSSSSSSSRLLPAARALELGYAAVALDHPHRGLLADSDRCRLAPFPALSSLPLPSSASLHRSRNGSPASEPFRQYTRITLSLDSAAAAASALAPSAARLLRTYDIVAARPLTQAALDHLCQSATEADIISIDFSHKLPFRLKLPMLKLAIQRGLHFEIAYSPLINDVNSRRQVLTEAKLLVNWTKGKNLIISSAACNANEIRGPYDVINLCAYLLGLSTERAKTAMSVNCRSLISKALIKKHFYKQTISIDRLLSSGQLDSTKCKLGDWIGWDPLFPKGDVQSLETNLKPSSKKDELPSSAINSVTRVVYEKSCDADEPLLVDEPKQSDDDKETPAKTQEGTAQVNTTKVLMSCGLSTLFASFGDQTVAKETTLDKPGNNEFVMTDNVHAVSASSADQKCIDGHVEFIQDAMEIDATESCTLNLIAGDSAHLSLDATKLACSSLSQSMELSSTSPGDKYPVKTSDILDNAKAFAEYDTGSASCEREYQVLLNHEIPSVSDACLEDEVMDKPDDIPVNSKVHRDTTESLGCSEGWRDDEAPLNLVLALSSSNLCTGTGLQQEVNKEKTEQNMEENIDQATSDKVGPIDSEASMTISAEHTLHGQDISSTAFVYEKETKDTAWETNELKEPNSKETHSSLEKDIAKTHQLLNNSCAGAKGEISTARSEKRKHKLWLRRPAYLPFLGFLKTVSFKKKACKVARKP